MSILPIDYITICIKVLSDKDKKATYDMYGTTDGAAGGFGGGGGGGGNPFGGKY